MGPVRIRDNYGALGVQLAVEGINGLGNGRRIDTKPKNFT
jgi:hypothetical protein